MPKLSLYFDQNFPDPRWAKTTYALEIPGGKSGEFVLGRSLVADLTFDVKSMSTRHAVIAYSYIRDSWTIDDLNSTNGIILRGVRMTPKKPEPLNIGDKFWLGPEAQIYCVEDEQDTTSPDETGPSTIASTTPLATLPTVPPTPTVPPPPTAEPAAPPSSKTPWDSLYLGTQWVISGQTTAGKMYRLIVAGAGVAILILMLD